MELGIQLLRRCYRQIQAQDLEWIKYLKGLEAGDLRDQEVQDRPEFSDRSGYMDVMDEAVDLEIFNTEYWSLTG